MSVFILEIEKESKRGERENKKETGKAKERKRELERQSE
jgi:hypothetical protein